ncbi:MAG: hypothetical protein ACXVCN_16575 [Bdellovibrio sp.]
MIKIVQRMYYVVARYCDKLSYGGYTDWYLFRFSDFGDVFEGYVVTDNISVKYVSFFSFLRHI